MSEPKVDGFFPLSLPLPFDVIDSLLTVRLFIIHLALETRITFPLITLMISSHSKLYVIQMGLSAIIEFCGPGPGHEHYGIVSIPSGST